jgi:short-subunit dehydrogenase
MGRLQQKTLLYSAVGIGAGFALRAVLRKRRAFDLRGRYVLITGGSRGLGLLLAREFAKEGAHLALCARNADELARAREDLAQLDADVFTVTCDLTEKSQIEAMVRRVEEHYGHIDVIVNNAGVIEVGPMHTMTDQDYAEAMNVHFWGPLHVIMIALPGMRARKRGRILNISSIGGKVSVPHLLPYDASKFALTGLSEGMRAELAQDGIYVTTVCPGLMRTGSQERAYFKGQNEKEYAAFSTLAALPIASMNAETAAKQIIRACKRGDAEIVLSTPAKLLATFHALFPGATADLFGLIDRLLPQPGGKGTKRAEGLDSHSTLSPSLLTANIDAAARANNEVT